MLSIVPLHGRRRLIETRGRRLGPQSTSSSCGEGHCGEDSPRRVLARGVSRPHGAPRQPRQGQWCSQKPSQGQNHVPGHGQVASSKVGELDNARSHFYSRPVTGLEALAAQTQDPELQGALRKGRQLAETRPGSSLAARRAGRDVEIGAGTSADPGRRVEGRCAPAPPSKPSWTPSLMRYDPRGDGIKEIQDPLSEAGRRVAAGGDRGADQRSGLHRARRRHGRCFRCWRRERKLPTTSRARSSNTRGRRPLDPATDLLRRTHHRQRMDQSSRTPCSRRA